MDHAALRPLASGEFTILAVETTELSILREKTELIEQIDSPLGPIFRVRLADQSRWSSEGFLIGLDGVGRLDAALRTIDALELIDSPRFFLIGIIGGFEDHGIALGDVVIADQILDYEMQRLSESGPEHRTRVYSLDRMLLNDCQSVISRIEAEPATRQSDPDFPSARYHIGAVLSGDKVVASSLTAFSLREIYPTAIGVEMEGAGVAAALMSRRRLQALCMIRGVADVANENKRDDAKMWQQIACERAADYTIEVIRESTKAI